MTNTQVFGLGAMLVVGMALHGVITRGPSICSAAQADSATILEVERERSAGVIGVEKVRRHEAESLALIARGSARTIVLGDHAILVAAKSNLKDDGDLTVTDLYYEYREGKLVQVQVESTPTK